MVQSSLEKWQNILREIAKLMLADFWDEKN